MDEKIITNLGEIYNTLLTIPTKGKDTVSMAFCLQTLQCCSTRRRRGIAPPTLPFHFRTACNKTEFFVS